MRALMIGELKFSEEITFAFQGDVRGGLVTTESGIKIEGSPEQVKIKGPLSSSTSVQENSSGTSSGGEGEVVAQPEVSQFLDLFGFVNPFKFP
jgi:hypothetical protein